MAQIPILSGIYTDQAGDLRTAYPVNLVPTPNGSGISDAYLRPAEGIVANGTGPGPDRGGINWNGVCYRVMGAELVAIDAGGNVATLGNVGNDGRPVTLDYSFDLLGIASAGNLWFWNPATAVLAQNVDPDLGTVVDMCWIDGYWMTTDGEFLVVTELNDPFAVNPLKYGSSEADPDPVVALLRLRNEVYAINRNTVEVFDNVGNAGFPFQRIDGAQIQKGGIGTFAACVFDEQIAFLGSGRNEQPGVYLGANATTTKISTQEIDELLATYTEAQLAGVKLEARNDRAHKHLYVHLPDRTVVFDAAASEALGQVIWFTLTTSVVDFAQYRARDFVWCYGRWLVGDTQTGSIGYLSDTVSSHWGKDVRWEFGTLIVYNESKGAIFNAMELVALTGRMAGVKTITQQQASEQSLTQEDSFDILQEDNSLLLVEPTATTTTQNLPLVPLISTSYSLDGMTWSQDRVISAGTIGNRTKRLLWTRQGFMRNWRIQRFRGTSDAHLSFVRLEAQLEPLGV